MIKKFVRKSQLPTKELHLYREVKRNLGHSGHPDNLPKVEKYDPFMTLRNSEIDQEIPKEL